MSIMDNSLKKSSDNGYKIVERKKITNQISNFFYNLSKEEKTNLLKKSLQKRSSRLRYCSEKKHLLNLDGINHNLYSHKCRDRQCVDCQAIKSFIWQKKISEVNEKLKEKLKAEDYSFLFLTFTIKNPKVQDLNATLKLMNKAIYQLFKHKKYILGGIRTTEITRGKSDKNECHPHFHLLLIVEKSFFDNKKIEVSNFGKHTLPAVEKQFSLEFQKYLKMYAEKYGLTYNENDYKETKTGGPIVEVCRAVGEDKKTYINLDNAVDNGGQIFGYILKYTVKGNGKPDDIIFKNDRWFLEYDKQIKNVRLITPIGLYKKELAELDNFKDYDFNEELEKINNKIQNVKSVSCDIYSYSNKDIDYLKEDSNLSINEKIENAILEKTYNQFRRAYISFFENVKNQNNSSEKFLNNDKEGNNNRIERMKKLLSVMESKGYFINLGNGSYCDKKTGEIYNIIKNKAVDNSAVENIKIDLFRNLDLIEKQQIKNDIEKQKQDKLSSIINEIFGHEKLSFKELYERLKRNKKYKNIINQNLNFEEKEDIKVNIINSIDDIF